MADNSGSLRHLIALRQRWHVAALVTASVLAISIPVALGLPNMYRASAKLLVDRLPTTFQQASGVWELDGRLQAIKQEALSRDRLTQLIERFDLYPALRRGGMLNSVIALVQKDVTVDITNTSQAGGGGVTTVAFTVTYVGNDPETVASVANWLASFYIEKNDAMRSQHATRTAGFLKTSLDATRKKLEAQEQRLIDFTTKNANSLPEQVQNIVAKYGQLTQQLGTNTTLQATLISQRDAAQNQIAALLVPRVGATATDPVARLAQARKDLEALELKFGSNMPEVRNKKIEIQQLEQAVAAGDGQTPENPAEATQLATLQSQVASANKRLDEIKKTNDEIHATMRTYDTLMTQAPVKSAEFDKVSRDLRAIRDEYDALQKQYQSANLAERAEQDGGGAEFRVLDSALPPGGPAAPDRRMLLAAASAAALLLGLGLVFVLDRFDGSFRSVDEVRAFTSVPVLVTIPKILTRADMLRQRLLTVAVGAVAVGGLWFVSLKVFQVASRLEGISRMLLRF